MKHACFTGHRKFCNINIQEIKLALVKLVEIAINEHKITHFYSGMAIGTDLLAAQVLTEMQLPWTAVIPCLDQSAKWSRNWQKIYYTLLGQATSDIVLQPQYSSGCMNRRNAWMIKHSDLLLSVWNEKPTKGSGTYNTVQMAQKKGIPTANWNPEKRQLKTFVKPTKQTQIHLNLHLLISL